MPIKTLVCHACNRPFTVKRFNSPIQNYCSRGKACIPLSERFWSKVNKTDTCWLWTGSLGTTGYGQLSIKHRPHLTHRLAWELTFGPIPKGSCVLHRCDVRHCVNPTHLFLGTYADNYHDAKSKNRHSAGMRNGLFKNPSLAARGEDNGFSKLTDEQVKVIRSVYQGKHGQLSALGRQFNVSHNTIRFVVHNITWKHLA